MAKEQIRTLTQWTTENIKETRRDERKPLDFLGKGHSLHLKWAWMSPKYRSSRNLQETKIFKPQRGPCAICYKQIYQEPCVCAHCGGKEWCNLANPDQPRVLPEPSALGRRQLVVSDVWRQLPPQPLPLQRGQPRRCIVQQFLESKKNVISTWCLPILSKQMWSRQLENIIVKIDAHCQKLAGLLVSEFEEIFSPVIISFVFLPTQDFVQRRDRLCRQSRSFGSRN